MALASALLQVMTDAVRKTARPMLRDFGEVSQLQVSRKGLIEANRRRLQCLSLFWHFLDVVWIGVFTFVYLLGVLR